jgi:hypothetical protein
MKTRLLLSVVALLSGAPAVGWALPKYADWARTPANGLSIPNAVVTVLDDHGALAAIYRDAAGTVAAPNPLTADGGGYFELFAASGAYELRVSADGSTELYRVSPILLVDPTGAQTISANPFTATLTIEQPAADHPLYRQYSTTAMRFERRTPAGALVDAPWLLNGYRAEQGMGLFYNTYGRYEHLPEAPGFPIGEPFGSNTADAGNFGLAGFNIDWHGGGILATGEGGMWLPAAAGTVTNVELGIEGAAPLPENVVVVSRTAPASVTLTTTAAARAPLVVTAVQNGRALVAVAGIATVQAKGKVRVGDVLATSSTAGWAQKAPAGTGASSIIGSALTASSGGAGGGPVRVRLGMTDIP